LWRGFDVKTRRVAMGRARAAAWAVFALLSGVLVWAATEVPSRVAEASPRVDGPDPEAELEALQAERRELLERLGTLRPRGAYVVVDRANNRIFLRKGDSVLVDAPASTGSRNVLKEATGQQRTWIFDTPPGRFSILAKRPDPVWTKPDWAFLEAGEPIPASVSGRREYGSLGEYALDLGESYMIHGTLYERLLGRSVTHGCVRVGRDPLRTIVRQVQVGSQVFIY
jgi:lipoprotein-anchoring transpeptidase ErfK/SrfK